MYFIVEDAFLNSVYFFVICLMFLLGDDVFDVIVKSLLSPALLFFLSGIFIGLCKTNLEIPSCIGKFLSVYLMAAIGLKGGVLLVSTSDFSIKILLLFIVSLVISFLMPFLAYFFLRMTTTIDQPTAGALSAHYGSVSIVTFMTAESFFRMQGVSYAGYLLAVLALMELPAIFSGIYIVQKFSVDKNRPSSSMEDILRSNGCLLLLLCSFAIGMLIGDVCFSKLKGFFESPFQGILCFFLLDMGLSVANQVEYVKKFTISLVLFGLYMPLLGSFIGLLVGFIFGFDAASTTIFMVLCASASYVAVPVVMRVAIPDAKVSIYLPMVLAVTFPFNVTIGIPLYYAIARYIVT